MALHSKINILYSKSPNLCHFVLVHFLKFTFVMLLVGNLVDETIQKEMSEEVKDFEANVSNISV